jgi:hypothetical protein
MKRNKNQNRTLRSLIRKETWELEGVKKTHKDAHANFDKAHAELEETSKIINELSSTLRESMSEMRDLSLDTMQMSKQYLMDKHVEQARKHKVRQRAKQLADKAATELKGKLLTKKGLEKTLDRNEQVLQREREKKSLSEIEQNWLSQRARDGKK